MFYIIIIVCGTALFGDILPLQYKCWFYTISIFLKSLLSVIIPFMVLNLSFNSVRKLSIGATFIMMMVIMLLSISNFTGTMFSYIIGISIYNFEYLQYSELILKSNIKSIYSFDFIVPFMNNSTGLLIGFIFGIVSSSILSSHLLNSIDQLSQKLSKIFIKTISSIIPALIMGFIIKMHDDGVIMKIMTLYSQIALIIILTYITYISMYYFICIDYKYKNFWNYCKGITPALLLGFSSMSSLAASPLTMKYVENNTKNNQTLQPMIPILSNIHLMGDCIFIPILAYTILKINTIEAISFSEYLPFAIQFVIAKFAVAAMPAGGIIVMIPLLEKYMHFTSEMSSLIMSIYIIFDPMITAMNIFGNGIFAHLLDKIFTKYKGKNAQI